MVVDLCLAGTQFTACVHCAVFTDVDCEAELCQDVSRGGRGHLRGHKPDVVRRRQPEGPLEATLLFPCIPKGRQPTMTVAEFTKPCMHVGVTEQA